jgi:hypothetical protein
VQTTIDEQRSFVVVVKTSKIAISTPSVDNDHDDARASDMSSLFFINVSPLSHH